MIIFAIFLLWFWIPIALSLFAILPPRKAVLVSSITGWLFLPSLGFGLPGLPDYTKSSATVLGALLGMALFDSGRVLRLRFRWYDLPVVIWCACPFVSSLTNGLGVYDGFSAVLGQVFLWGFPYLVGRCYFDDCEGVRDLAVAIVAGGLMYVPLCLWEIRMSPQLANHIYGLGIWAFEGGRYGGFRPRVFMGTGLELGMWMTAASLTGVWMWASGSVRHLWGYPFGTLLGILIVTTILCKSTGALVLLLFGLVISWLIGKMKWVWPLWVLVLIPPMYEGLRATNLTSRRSITEIAEMLFNEDRAGSLDFRLMNEDLLAEKALERPFFGWGGWSRARVSNKMGKDISITDGYWIILLGNQGLVGLASGTLAILMPLILLIHRIPPRRWIEPRFSAAGALAILLSLYMIDNLFNAMMNPIYALAIGGLTALQPDRIANGVLDPRYHQAESQRVRASQLASAGLLDAAIELYRQTVQMGEGLVALHPSVAVYRQGLARACIDLGQLLRANSLSLEAKRIWCQALELQEGLVREFPNELVYREQWIDHLNNLAWFLATAPEETVHDPARAAVWATTAVEHAPEDATYWNTLGVAYFGTERWQDAIVALENAVTLGAGGTSFDHFYLALAQVRCGDTRTARSWYDRAVAWMDAHKPHHPELLRLRGETAAFFDDRVCSAWVKQPMIGAPGSDRGDSRCDY
jgi:tetratricopeptide (TPR) repeat protein